MQEQSNYKPVKCDICGETVVPTSEKPYVYSGDCGKCYDCWVKAEVKH